MTERDPAAAENAALRARLDLETVLREVVESARALTGARLGGISTIDEAGAPQNFVTSGFSAEEHRRMAEWSDGPRLFEHFRDLPGLLRLADVPDYVHALGFPTDRLPLKIVQITPMRHRRVHVGNFYLAEKEGGEPFTDRDEEILVMFAAQAATAIANARTYRAGPAPGRPGALGHAPDAAPILVVDDDPETLRHLRDTLAEAGYAPLVTGDPREMPRIIRAEKPRLVLLDLMLPGTDGVELMRTVPELADLPVIFISGYGRALTTGARACPRTAGLSRLNPNGDAESQFAELDADNFGGPPLLPARFPPASVPAVLVAPVTMRTDPEHPATVRPPATPLTQWLFAVPHRRLSGGPDNRDSAWQAWSFLQRTFGWFLRPGTKARSGGSRPSADTSATALPERCRRTF